MRFLLQIVLLFVCAVGGFAQETGLRVKLNSILPFDEHRNWIVVADSAYPAQTRGGIETVVAGANRFEALCEVPARLVASKHIVWVVWTEEESLAN